MSPKAQDPAIRVALIEAAARCIAEHEPLTTRRLAAEVGTSTAAVYTYFGSMDELRRAVRSEGFRRFTGYLRSVPTTNDPVADLYELGLAYAQHALDNPHLYRVMFMDAAIDAADAAVGYESYGFNVACVNRCIQLDRFTAADPGAAALHVWATLHGLVSAVVVNLFPAEQIVAYATQIAENMFVGLGDNRSRARASIASIGRTLTLPDATTTGAASLEATG